MCDCKNKIVICECDEEKKEEKPNGNYTFAGFVIGSIVGGPVGLIAGLILGSVVDDHIFNHKMK